MVGSSVQSSIAHSPLDVSTVNTQKSCMFKQCIGDAVTMSQHSAELFAETRSQLRRCRCHGVEESWMTGAALRRRAKQANRRNNLERLQGH
jgi:hypothetical protein